MTQQAFNNSLDKLANEICRRYYYNDEDLRSKVFNKTYDELDHNLKDFDNVLVSYTPLKTTRIEAKIEIISQNKVIQTIKFAL